jgi:hypothetical protein
LSNDLLQRETNKRNAEKLSSMKNYNEALGGKYHTSRIGNSQMMNANDSPDVKS